MKMPEKDPGLWASAIEWISQHVPFLPAILLSAVIAILRTIYGGGKNWRHVLLEGLICACLTVGAMSGMEWFGVPTSAGAFVGSLIGFVGVKKLGEFAETFLGRKVEKS
jgi:lambda family phage holin